MSSAFINDQPRFGFFALSEVGITNETVIVLSSRSIQESSGSFFVLARFVFVRNGTFVLLSLGVTCVFSLLLLLLFIFILCVIVYLYAHLPGLLGFYYGTTAPASLLVQKLTLRFVSKKGDLLCFVPLPDVQLTQPNIVSSRIIIQYKTY